MIKASIASEFQIGIATKNRWDDLKITLSKIVEYGWGDIRVIIFDDCSDVPCPYCVSDIHPKAELTRFEESQGYICRRNQIAHAMTSTYYLSLDDDSFPLRGDIEPAIKFANSCQKLVCLSFPIINAADEFDLMSLKDSPYEVQTFIGCSHLMHRQRFIDIGGYREELIHQGEEVEFSARAILHGFDCYHCPYLTIQHMASLSGRNRHRMDYYAARNSVLWNNWFLPRRLTVSKQLRSFIGRLLITLTTRRIGPVQGFFAGIREIRSYKGYRKPMSVKMYKKWIGLPPH